MEETERKMQMNEASTEKVVHDWRARVRADEERARRLQEQKDDQMKEIVARLISVEEELKKEQIRMQAALNLKDRIIESQDRKIQSLHATNAQLHAALMQLKEQCQSLSCNGISSKSSSLNEIAGEYKSSQC